MVSFLKGKMDHPIPHDWVIDNKVLTIPTYEPPKDQPVVINADEKVERRLKQLFNEIEILKNEVAQVKHELHMDVLIDRINQLTNIHFNRNRKKNAQINELKREIKWLRHDINWFTRKMNENVLEFIQDHDRDHQQLIVAFNNQLEFIHRLIGAVDDNTLAIDEVLKGVTDRVWLIEHKNYDLDQGDTGAYLRQALPDGPPPLALGEHIASIQPMPLIPKATPDLPVPPPDIPPPPDPPGIPPPPPAPPRAPPRIVRRPPPPPP